VKRYDTLDNYGVTPDTDIKGLLDRNKVQYLFISKQHSYYAPSGKYCYTRIEFESLNDKLADTGYSIANYVQPALGGGGYAGPRLKLAPGLEPDHGSAGLDPERGPSSPKGLGSGPRFLKIRFLYLNSTTINLILT
jgi:hypothetical protein